MPIVWKSVPNFEGYYQASNTGLIKSLDRNIEMLDGRTYKAKGQVLKGQKHPKTNYWSVALYKCQTVTRRTIHSLVCESFYGPTPSGLEICHINGNVDNNELSNLCFDTTSNNAYDTVLHGTHFNAQKLVCPRGHKLVEPNLMRANLKQGGRSCLACSRARATVSNNKLKGVMLDFNLEANNHYHRIMKN